jgi:hypothetical protein
MHPGDHAPPQGGLWAPFWAFCSVCGEQKEITHRVNKRGFVVRGQT